MASVRLRSGIPPLHFHIWNPQLRLDNGIPASFPYLLGMAPESTHRFDPRKYPLPQCIRCLPQSGRYIPVSSGISHVVIFHVHKGNVRVRFTVIIPSLEAGGMPAIDRLTL